LRKYDNELRWCKRSSYNLWRRRVRVVR